MKRGGTYSGKREAHPGKKPGDLVSHNNTINTNATPVTIS